MSLQLKAEKREKLGSLSTKRLKKSGRIPAVIQSKNGNVNISFDKREFEIEFSKGNLQTKLIEIEVDGKKFSAIANKIELDPVSDNPIHIDLLDCNSSKTLKAWPKINFINADKSIGLKKGGFLNIRKRKVAVFCENEKAIIETIDIDISSLQVGQKIRANQINLPKGLKFAEKDNFLVASITGRGKAEEETKAADATATAAATPAAGAAAKADEKKPADKK